MSHSANASAVAGHNDAGGVGVFGGSPGGYAFSALGNTTQDRASSGFVKAMLYFDPINHSSDPIQQCFNSELPPSQATNLDCGITWSNPFSAVYDLDFGFRVDDRFALTTSAALDVTVSATPIATNTLRLGPRSQGGGNISPFFVFVY